MMRESESTSSSTARHTARVHGWLLGAAFVTGVGCFVASTLYTDTQLRDIEPQTEAIAERAIPAILHLSSFRADLRDVGTDVEDELAEHPGAADRTDHALRDADVEMKAYLRMPRAGPQQSASSSMVWSFERIQQGLRDVREKLASGDAAGAAARFDAGPRFHLRQLDDSIAAIMDADARDSRAAAIAVARERRRARTVAFSLDGLSLAASLAFGLLVFARIRRDDRAIVDDGVDRTLPRSPASVHP